MIVGGLDVLSSTTGLSPPQADIVSLMLRSGCAQILSLVEDALAVGFDGTGHFRLKPEAARLREDVLERAWEAVRLQPRFSEKAKSIRMELEVESGVPRSGVIDAARCVQVITNLGAGPPLSSPFSLFFLLSACCCLGGGRGAGAALAPLLTAASLRPPPRMQLGIA